MQHYSLMSILIPTIIGSLLYFKIHPRFKILAWLFIACCLIEYWSYNNKFGLPKYTPNVVLYLVEFTMISCFYAGLKKWVVLWSAAYIVFALLTNSLNVLNPNLKLSMSIPLVLLSGYGFYASCSKGDWAVALVSCGFFLYFCMVFSYPPFFVDKLKSAWIAVHSPINIFMNLSCAGGFYVSSRTTGSGSFFDSGGIDRWNVP